MSIVSLFHILPLFLILGIFSYGIVQRMARKNTDPICSKTRSVILILSSIGIACGAHCHHITHYLIDPCFGYALSILYVAYKGCGIGCQKNRSAE